MIEESIRDVLRNNLLESEKKLKKLPPNTKIYPDGLNWSSWDGLLALVTGPSHYAMNTSSSDPDFDPAMMARKYSVRFATDIDGKRLKPPSPGMIGLRPAIADGSKPYHQTTWSSGTPGYGPVQRGSFEKKVHRFAVQVKLKDLGDGEMRAVQSLYDSYGYIEEPSGSLPRKIKQAEWKKIFAKRKFVDTQDMDSDLANAAYELLKVKNAYRYPEDERLEQILWDSIPGIYITTKKANRITAIIKK